MLDEETLKDIIKFGNVINAPPDASDSDQDSIDGHMTNRGNKLKRGARLRGTSVLGRLDNPLKLKLVEYCGVKHAVLTKSSKVLLQDGTTQCNSDDDHEPGALDDVNVAEIIRPIMDPADVCVHPAVSKTFNSTRLADMAKDMLDLIVEEKSHETRLCNLLASLLGDNKDYLKLESFQLPEYTSIDDPPYEGMPVPPRLPENGNLVGLSSICNTDEEEHPVNPFFAPPAVSIDRNMGVTDDHAEEARQLLQIAHQRMEEFVRCMVQVRRGLTKADRRRRQVLHWCKELNGQDYVEEEVGPNDYATRNTSLLPIESDAAASGPDYANTTERSS